MKLNEDLDINDFFDAEFDDPSDEDAEIDDATANYYIARIKKDKELKEMYSEKAKAIKEDYVQKLAVWEQKHYNRLDNDIEYCLARLKSYYDARAKDEKTKLSLPEGNIGFYAKPQSISIDKEVVMQFIKEHPELNKYIQYKPDLDTKSLRKDGIIDEEYLFKIDGSTLPGVIVKPASKVFNIR